MSPRGAPRASSSAMVAVGDRRLYVETCDVASDACVVLLHSGLGSTADWRASIPALAESGYRTVAYDRLGHGESGERVTAMPPPFEPEVRELAELLDVLDVPEAVLVGHSDGGTIALSFAATHPQRVTCVVAAAAHVCVELKTRRGIAAFVQHANGDEKLLAALERRHGDKAQTLLEGWANAWLRPEALGWDMRPELAGVRCPALVVQGLEDEYATEDHARDIAAWIDGAELWLEPGANHVLPQAMPEAFNERLLDFLARHGG